MSTASKAIEPETDDMREKLNVVWNCCCLANANYKFTDRAFFAKVLRLKLERYTLEVVESAAITMAQRWNQSVFPNPHTILEQIRIADDQRRLSEPAPERHKRPSAEVAYTFVCGTREAAGLPTKSFEEFAVGYEEDEYGVT